MLNCLKFCGVIVVIVKKDLIRKNKYIVVIIKEDFNRNNKEIID